MQTYKSPLLVLCGILLNVNALSATEAEGAKVDISQVTVSGLSSGGYMATQFHIAHSEMVSGAGIIGAGPYYCGRNDIATALAQCVSKTSEFLVLDELNEQIDVFLQQQKIAPMQASSNDKVWLFHGLLDQTVNRKAADMLALQYSQWVKSEHIEYVSNKAFSHHFPALQGQNDCSVSEAPFIGDCGYDAAGEMLKHLYPSLKPKAEMQAQDIANNLFAFDQQTLGGNAASSLADTGYAYVPDSCQQGEACEVHVSFHGCNQNAQAVGREYALNTGINQWAQNNHLVVLYPQTKKSLFMPLNPQACWDWWGYTDAQYATKEGQQVQAVRAMLSNIDKIIHPSAN